MAVSIRYFTAAFFLRLAWRNLWRNRKRTLITCSSVLFAVFLAIVTKSTINGWEEYTVQTTVAMYTGHLQLHGRGFGRTHSLDQSLAIDTAMLRAMHSLHGVSAVTTRLEAGALVSHGPLTKVSPVIGIDPENEQALTGIARRVARGIPYSSWRSGAIVAEGLARLLKADIGDSLVLYGQGYRGATAAMVVRIAAVAHFPVNELNNAMVYLPLTEAQVLFDAPGRATTIALLLHDDAEQESIEAAVRGIAGPSLEAQTWREMMPEILQALAVKRGGSTAMLLILYLVIGFGIFGTVTMMTIERSREFGITIAVGMQRWRLMLVTVIEAILVSMSGALAGIALAIPLLAYFHRYPIVFGGSYGEAMIAYGVEPILPLSLDPSLFIAQAAIVFALAILCSLYPVIVLRRLEPVSAMRH
jgi:ABC-type lipoprotein release transport system permease subunit